MNPKPFPGRYVKNTKNLQWAMLMLESWGFDCLWHNDGLLIRHDEDNLRWAKTTLERLAGFKCKWTDSGVVARETPRIVHCVDYAKSETEERWIMYAVDFGRFVRLDRNSEWSISLILGGPPFWTTHNQDLAADTAKILNIPILEEFGR